MFVKSIKSLLLLIPFFYSAGFVSAAQSGDHDALSDGLTKKERARFMGAMQAYMLGTPTTLGLNQTCRYQRLEEMSLCFPTAFFEVGPAPSMPHLKMVVYLKKGVPFSKALDSLIAPLLPEEERIIECKYAAHLAFLQGIRAVIEDDAIFDAVCEKLTGGKKTEIWSFTNQHLFVKSKSVVPGGLCYLKQICDLDYFLYPEGFLFRASPYEHKHIDGVNLGINLITINGGCCVFFEPGVKKEMSLKQAAKQMMDAMEADLSDAEIAYIQQFQLGQADVAELNQIKYKDPAGVLKEILSSAIYFAPDFKGIIACRAEIYKAKKAEVTAIKTRVKALRELGVDPQELEGRSKKPSKRHGKNMPAA